LLDLGIVLPRPPRAIGHFAEAVEVGSLLFVSGTYGTVPDEEDGSDRLPRPGKLGGELTVADGYQSARIVCLNLLAMARSQLGTLDRVDRVVRLAGYVNAVVGFTDAPAVMNGASDLLIDVFGVEFGTHARISLYQQDLPRDAPLAAELLLSIRT
jgi:enamine deaminase RidA (YjgF/YER057c/UK114 family)